MENRYLFRGKRTDNNEWVYGLPSCDEDGEIEEIEVWSEDDINFYSVDPSTVCQCTGLEDKNGRLIFENDIVKDLFSDIAAPIRYGSYQSCFDSTKVEHVGFYVDWSGKYNKNYRKDLGYWIHMVDAEIIGNAIDNLNLLEV
jgi:uncharacterized phage protein (TIGR01671 family)|nr:MAG TPA: YopX protein [Caudoviricetes sp.]DAQ61849.1 MAG TPA: YopX protein [Caudoviricetes sp.]